MAMWGQVVGYEMLEGPRKMGLKEISERTGVLISTCSNIIRRACQWANKNNNQDLCTQENLAPLLTSVKRSNEVLTQAQKDHLVQVTLQDADHCHMTFTQLAEAGSLFFFFFFFLFERINLNM